QTFQAVSLDPVGQENGVSVFRLSSSHLGLLQQIQSPHQMPGWKVGGRLGDEEIFRILTVKIHIRASRRLQKITQGAVHERIIVSSIYGTIIELAVGIVGGEVKS